MHEYEIKQSENGNQWFVMVKEGTEWKIGKVYYSKKRCEEYITVEKSIAAVEASRKSA